MVKKKPRQKDDLSNALIKSFSTMHRGKRRAKDNTTLHTAELSDGYKWDRLNLRSVTEQSTFEGFISIAERVEDEFKAEKRAVRYVNPATTLSLMSEEEKREALEVFEQNKDIVKIPRKPDWTRTMTKEEYDKKVKEAFVVWRRELAFLQEEKGIKLTPYELNLKFWEQLWGVVEKSDVVVQIVDARNPNLFRSEDLEKYVNEVSENKLNMVLLNKADLLSEEQRRAWAKYFNSLKLKYAFFSATLVLEELKNAFHEKEIMEESKDEEDTESDDTEEKQTFEDVENKFDALSIKENKINDEVIDDVNEKVNDLSTENKEQGNDEASSIVLEDLNTNILSRIELIQVFKNIHHTRKVQNGITTIGFIGYPNVGKSSTINALLTKKKVSVSATPGKTKHFQTLYLEKDLLLCDCPGLVMPSFIFSKAHMIINGILPVDQMTDHVPSVNLICSLIPKHVLEDMYSTVLPEPENCGNQSGHTTADKILNAYAYIRGFMTANGQPDNARASRYVIKDFINGKLLYVNAPPGINQDSFNKWPEARSSAARRELTPRERLAILDKKVDDDDLFLEEESNVNVYQKGRTLGVPVGTEKPWKKENKHKNKKKKEKLRRLYRHLDEH